MRLGVKGYVLKGRTVDELIQAIHEVSRGYYYLSQPLLKLVIKVCVDKMKANGSELNKLNPREKDVLLLLTQGLTNNEIAERLGIRIRTVEAHRMKARRKLGIRGNGATLIRYLMQNGLRH